eukprot:CAMPEP_0119476060 /NCGR_PEP_ID=MMETSP1344-20130328/6724_1 /TAXON_ID=236787 /ORGANISM="Florenciella parvula, Strain CCMP2471" /LENGTH=61 /DNA_ID=CAMNT_0007509743 /DNA_START=1056 /DNA_END=1241 /DNA_ORIENTATION=-
MSGRRYPQSFLGARLRSSVKLSLHRQDRVVHVRCAHVILNPSNDPSVKFGGHFPGTRQLVT